MKNLLQVPLGIEIESVVAHQDTLRILPIVSNTLQTANNKPATDYVDGSITWSNELVNHVIEFKVTKPAILCEDLAQQFHQSMKRFSKIAATYTGVVLPTGMHPLMNPATETQIWPGEYHDHYLAYHNIFNCFTHGFANLQSVHINIPFHSEEEFGRLIAGIRLVLPLIPALAASSPIQEGKITGYLDNRLEVYRTNQKKVASITGKIIPEQIFDYNSYKKEILQKMYSDIAPFDPHKILQTEQLNSRGCIARFDRNTLEIRLLDAQENPISDIAVSSAVIYILNELLEEKWTKIRDQKAVETDLLYELLTQTIKLGEQTKIENLEYLQQFGLEKPCTLQELLTYILDPYITQLVKQSSSFAPILKHTLEHGPLSRRILNKLPSTPTQEEIIAVYKKLAKCFDKNVGFL